MQDAKMRLGDVIQSVEHEPQTITVNGVPAAVLIVHKPKIKRKSIGGFLRLMQSSPLRGIDLDGLRDRRRGRAVEK